MQKQRLLPLLGALVVLGLLVPLLWYLLSTPDSSEQGEELLPTPAAEQASSTPLPPDPQGTATMEAAMAAPDQVVDEPLAGLNTPALTVLAQGSFYSLAHDGRGRVRIFRLEDGSRVLRIENFWVVNGPELRVHLVPLNPVPNSQGQEIPGAVDLGPLKGNAGGQNYPLPPELDLAPFNSVVIWSRPFAVPFIAAPLSVTE